MSSDVDSQTAPINFLYSYLVGEVFPLGRGKSPALTLSGTGQMPPSRVTSQIRNPRDHLR